MNVEVQKVFSGNVISLFHLFFIRESKNKEKIENFVKYKYTIKNSNEKLARLVKLDTTVQIINTNSYVKYQFILKLYISN